MDAFSSLLSAVRMSGAMYFNAEFSAPWGVANPPSRELAPALAPRAPHLVIYHFIAAGHAFARMDNGHLVRLGPGDVVILPHGDPHLVTSDPASTESKESAAVLRKVLSRELTMLRTGGGGTKTRIVCGYMACDPDLIRPILSGLPPVFRVNIRTDPAGQWLESSILHLVDEAASAEMGSAAMLAKISEALFVDTLRRYVASLPEQQTGWLAGARDPVVGKSLGLLHRHVDRRWTSAALAREVGVSRSTLVERFTRYLSEPPMTYLTRWRLQLAATSLARTPKGVAEIGSEVGYESESAFNRAFKREFGVPPARYRREHDGSKQDPRGAS